MGIAPGGRFFFRVTVGKVPAIVDARGKVAGGIVTADADDDAMMFPGG
ncbi:MAG: hypothetical protein QF926_15080 [Alphaproteobacteria bacterium]|jgi:hypothetical protein|nr:hypothetical protein [Alphaproteobacteria bacterium]MDP6517927.1 hypothetical protein [Alphaproteobacteria bacterium]